MKLQDLLNESNEGNEHARLRKVLDKEAKLRGYFIKYDKFPSALNPDVLLDDSNGNLFMGDAKDSENETVDNDATTKRIAKYIKEYSRIYKRGEISGGCIAIATNDEFAAYEWRDWLNIACEDCNLSNPDFDVEYVDEDTFIVIWVIW